MKIKYTCTWKDPEKDIAYLENWYRKIQELNGSFYERLNILTSLGNTIVWSLNKGKTDLESLVIFPGFRTSAFFWDMENGLEEIKKHFRVFLIDTNGQPNMSDGNNPAIKTEAYGAWANEVITQLGLTKTHVAGASFGGMVCMKLSMIAHEKIGKMILLNPAGLQAFSMKFTNLYFNVLPIIFPKRKNIIKFLDNVVFHPPQHDLPEVWKNLLIDFELHAITRFKDKTDKPYAMREEEFKKIKNDTYLILGEKDILFPNKKSVKSAHKNLSTLKKMSIIPNAGHGIETHKEAMKIMLGNLNEK